MRRALQENYHAPRRCMETQQMPYDNTNRGTIGKNKRKESENHPDIAGTINVDGRDYWINGWQKVNQQDGSKFYSLTVKPKDSNTQAPQSSGYGAGGTPMDDEIPFAASVL